MKAIIAMSENRCIGRDGKLPFHSSGDLKWFKEFTMGKTLVMGRKTYDTLPVLKGRDIIVITHDKARMFGDCIRPVKCENLFVRNGKELIEDILDIEYPISECKEWPNLTVAGGKSIYELFMPYITEFYVTILDINVDGDCYMEPFEHLFGKNEVIREFEGGKVIKYYDRIIGSHTIIGTLPSNCKICDAVIYNEPEDGFNHCSDCGHEFEV